MSVDLGVRRRPRGIGLTALIDVVFILLMFFMLSSSFSRFGYLGFDTRSSIGNSAGLGDEQMLILQADGHLVSTDNRNRVLTDSALMAVVDTSQTLFLLPVADADVQTMVQAIERLNRIGLSQVTLGSVLPDTTP